MIAAATASEVHDIVQNALSPEEWDGFPDALPVSDAARAEAEALVVRWRKLISLRTGSSDSFERRLQTLGLSHEQALVRLIRRSLPEDARLPDWATMLATVRDECSTFSKLEALLEDTDEESRAHRLESDQRPSFPGFLAPFLSVYLRHAGLEDNDADSKLGPECKGYFVRSLLRRLSNLAARTIAHELRKLRSLGELKGSSAEERFEYYASEVLGSPTGRWKLLCAYPVLARLLATCTLQMIEATIEFLERLRRDWRDLEATFGNGEQLGSLAACVCGLSDAHGGGRSVWILRFSSGVQVVYKPRSLDMDAAFSGLTQWLNGTGKCTQLRPTLVLARDEYGWSEFFHPGDCDSEEQIALYYRRQGLYASLFYFLCGVDFHSENFIAAGEDPMPIDLEGILSLGAHVGGVRIGQLPVPLRPLEFTVASTMMLPYWRAGEYDRGLFPAAGIGGSGDEKWPVKQPAWEGWGTDEFRLARIYEQFAFEQSVPTREGQKVRADPYGADVLAGFVEGYRAILENRATLLSPEGPLEPFRSPKCRVILRDTQEYVNLLFWMTSPDILASGSSYYVASEVLAWSIPSFGDGTPCPEILREEKECLSRRDVPLFTCFPDSRDVYISCGQSFGPAVEQTAFDQMRRRIQDASAADLKWQCELIQTMLRMAHSTGRGAAPDLSSTDLDRLLSHAIEIGESLSRVALRLDEGISWLSLYKASAADSKVQPVHSDPWSLAGAAGNAIFLADLAAVTGEKRFAALAGGGLRFACRMFDEVRKTDYGRAVTISAYEGRFALVYALSACGVRLGDEDLIRAACKLALSFTPEQLSEERNPDVLNGAAGALLVLLTLYRSMPDAGLIDRAETLAQVIHGTQDAAGEGWIVPTFQRPLLGMAHGSAGIALALLRLYEITGNDRLRNSALAGLAHERSHFSREQSDWPNLQGATGSAPLTGWCGGAPGIGLARLGMSHAIPLGEEANIEMEAAIQTTLRHLGKHQHHLCCGEAGRIAFLSTAAAILNRPVLRESAVKASISMIDYFEEHGHWRLQQFCASLPVSGLLGGVPGIGMSLLELARPGSTSRVTLLQ